MKSGAFDGSLHALVAYGPAAAPVWFWIVQPCDEFAKATKFFAACSLSPDVVLAMYSAFGSHSVSDENSAAASACVF